MAYKSYRIELDGQAHIAIEFTTFKGEVISFVVWLMKHTTHGKTCILRYDTAHGCPHFDIVNHRGKLVYKEWLLGMSFSAAMRHAINDLKLNHETYLSQFKDAPDQQT